MTTYFQEWGTCRVCHDQKPHDELVKYSVRHYACPTCAMLKWGGEFFKKITPWQASQFPYFTAKDFGALDALIARVAEDTTLSTKATS